jgi:multidrug efflux pump
MPLVFVTGAGAEARNSIGIMLVSGMAIGTFFTLFILPAIYLVIASEHRRETHAEPAGGDGVAPLPAHGIG